MPSFLEYINRKGTVPAHLAFSLAALIAFYSGSEIREGALIGNRNGEEYLIKDDAFVLEFFAENSALDADRLAEKVLSNESFWGTDLTKVNGALENVSGYLRSIRELGMREAMKKI